MAIFWRWIRYTAVPDAGQIAVLCLPELLMRRPRFVIGLLMVGGAVVGLACGQASPPAPVRPNVLVVVWDTVRADRMSLYGYERATTPHLDAWAKGARVYDDALSSAPITTSAHASMFTGLLPYQHEVDNQHPRLADGHETLAELLAAAGYRSYLFSANPYVGPETGLAQGFERYENPRTPAFREVVQALRARKARPYIPPGKSPPHWAPYVAATGALGRDGLVAWLARSAQNAPYFAVLNYMEAHLPVVPDREYRERFMTPSQLRLSYTKPIVGMPVWFYTTGMQELDAAQVDAARATYDAAIAELDELFHQLLVSLEQGGWLENTLVILTSDHGELLGEHHMWDHQFAVHEELLRVPLILWNPERIEPGREPRPVMTLDLFQTVLELTGLMTSGSTRGPSSDGASGAAPGGVSLLHPLDERLRLSEYPAPAGKFLDRVAAARPGFDRAPYDRSLRALRSRNFKYVWASNGDHALYDLSTDAGEAHNLLGERPELAEALRQDLRLHLRINGEAGEGGGAAAFDAETHRMLEALGYATDGADADR